MVADRLVRMHSRNWLSNVSNNTFLSLWVDWGKFLATFHDAINGAVPQIVGLLEDSNDDVRSAAQDAIGKLVEQCKRWCLPRHLKKLILISSHIPPRNQVHCSSNHQVAEAQPLRCSIRSFTGNLHTDQALWIIVFTAISIFSEVQLQLKFTLKYTKMCPIYFPISCMTTLLLLAMQPLLSFKQLLNRVQLSYRCNN